MFFCSVGCLLQFLMSHWLTVVLVCVATYLLHRHYTSTHSHFLDMGVPYMKPTIVLGNIGPRMRLKVSFYDFNIDIYNRFKGSPCGGFFEGRRPMLVLIDPELIKTVMIKDFDNFTDRFMLRTNMTSYWDKTLLSLKGKEWRSVRSILTPAFSSGKLRGMEGIVQQCGRQMVDFLTERLSEGDGEFEMREFTIRYTMEIIGSCAFGLECSSLKDPNADFIKVALNLNNVPLVIRYIFFLSLMLFPSVLAYLPLSVVNTDSMSQLASVVDVTRKEREQNPQKRRNDFMQIMIDAAHKEAAEGDNVMTDTVLKAQAVLFLIAGFETTSTLLSFACHSLALNPDIQDRLRRDIMKAVQEHGKDCTYDVANDIPYLEQVLLETLRRYPPVPRVDRVCTKDYVLPNTTVKVRVGDSVAIPVAGIMQDPDYYEDPLVFNPDRFSSEEKNIRNNSMFLAFGMGPRNCIGLRFAMMSAKFYLFYLLQNFKLSPCSKTQNPIKIDKKSILLKAESGIWLNIESLDAK